jgi:hypothetical protein
MARVALRGAVDTHAEGDIRVLERQRRYPLVVDDQTRVHEHRRATGVAATKAGIGGVRRSSREVI